MGNLVKNDSSYRSGVTLLGVRGVDAGSAEDFGAAGRRPPLVAEVEGFGERDLAGLAQFRVLGREHGLEVREELAGVHWVEPFPGLQEPLVGLSLNPAVVLLNHLGQ